MKKILLLALILGSSLVVNAQKDTKPRLSTANAQGKMESQVKLCQLIAYSTDDGKMKIVIDFGDTSKFNKYQNEEITKERYDQRFSNIIDALRFMRDRGWQIVEDYDLMEKESKVLYFILKRR